MTETERLYADALSLKLFNRNVNPEPSQAWIIVATEDEIAEWQNGDKILESILAERIRVQKVVEMYTLEEFEELSGLRHSVPPLSSDFTDIRHVNIAKFTLQKIRREGSKMKAVCVFHDDHHPSCALYPTEGFYCFSCGKGGNAVDWAMQEFGFNFKQAEEFLQRYV